MSGRLQARFHTLAAERRCGLAAFVTAGEPAPDEAVALWLQLARAGADILEIGLPADAWRWHEWSAAPGFLSCLVTDDDVSEVGAWEASDA